MENEDFDLASKTLLARLFVACVYGMSDEHECDSVTVPFGILVVSAVEKCPDKESLSELMGTAFRSAVYDDADRRIIRNDLGTFLGNYETTLQVSDPVFNPITDFNTGR